MRIKRGTVDQNHIDYAIVVDAGSSGSRIQIYSWTEIEYLLNLKKNNDNKYLSYITKDGLPYIEQGSSEDNFDSQLKLEEGISSYSEHPEDIGPNHVKLLMDYALTIIPEDKIGNTSVYLYATAGMRLLTKEKQDKILEEIYNYIKNNYSFVINNFKDDIRVITGEEEGLFGWLSVNYLEHGFSIDEETLERTPYNFVDMGGASTQIAFELDKSLKLNNKSDNILSLSINTLDSETINFNIYVITYLGFGVNEARRRYLEDFIKKNRESNKEYKKLAESNGITISSSKDKQSKQNKQNKQNKRMITYLHNIINQDSNSEMKRSLLNRRADENQAPKIGVDKDKIYDKIVWKDPCLPTDTLQEEVGPVDFVELYGQKEGDLMSKYISIKGSGKFDECANNVYPFLNETVPCNTDSCLFNGIFSPTVEFNNTEFMAIGKYWDVSNAYGLGGVYNYTSFLESSRDFCKVEWSIHEKDYNNNMYPEIRKPYDLAMNCFRSAWLETIIHDGYNIPKENPDDIPLTSLSYINGTEASWALGALIKKLSDEIGLVEKNDFEKKNEDTSSGLSTVSIVGISIGTVAIIAGIFAVVVMRWKSRNRHIQLTSKENVNEEDEEYTSVHLMEEGQKETSSEN